VHHGTYDWMDVSFDINSDLFDDTPRFEAV
jgi:hypothetical protein